MFGIPQLTSLCQPLTSRYLPLGPNLVGASAYPPFLALASLALPQPLVAIQPGILASLLALACPCIPKTFFVAVYLVIKRAIAR